LRWLEGAEDDLRELDLNRWREQANNREEWTPVVKDAEVLRGP
jgi:hypothetical protein